MIDYISGPLAETNPTYVVIDCNGIGYIVSITLQDYSKLEKEKSGKLYVHEVIREDVHDLYGFLTRESREMFRMLIGVSGVGPNTARLILSALSLEQLQDAIGSGNDKLLKEIKGIGGKTAQRIIVDLRDKIKSTGTTLSTMPGSAHEDFDDSLAALMMLGYSQQQCQKALKKLFAENPGLTTERAIRMALKML